MKKFLTILVAIVMALGFSGTAMASSLATGTIGVTATVAPFAAITGIDGISLSFSGIANQTVSGTDTITVERNTSVNIIASTSTLTGPGGDTIATSVTPDVLTALPPGKGIGDVNITVTGETGAISAQAAGAYSATVTVTVSAI